MKSTLSYFIVLCFLLTNCQIEENKETENESDYQLGEVELKVTGNSEAKAFFEKGLLLLHSFEYQDAREAFLEAQEADPNMAMAYWGEAMSYNHSLWHEQDYEDGGAAIKKMNAAAEKQELSPLEQDFMKAVEILYKEKTPKPERDKMYAAFLEELSKKYPQNQEIAAFYALSLLGSVEEGRDETIYGKGALVAQGILKENPNHPGALHYLIHSYDDPDNAPKALEAAFSYAEVAPDASHALHMPSHIYIALGMWDQVVKSNERSYQASLNRMKRKNLDNNARGYHAYHWLQYGYLQQGRMEKAKEMVSRMQQYSTENPSKRARVHMVYLQGTYLVETNDWGSDIADIPVDINDLNVSIRSQYRFIQGMNAFKAKDKAKLEEVINTIKTDHQKEVLLVDDSKLAMCSGATRETASTINIDESKAMEYQLRGLKAWLEGDDDKAEEWLKKSIDLEQNISYSFGPPRIKKPTTELYAECFLVKKDMMRP